jgi:hypothetical protein
VTGGAGDLSAALALFQFITLLVSLPLQAAGAGAGNTFFSGTGWTCFLFLLFHCHGIATQFMYFQVSLSSQAADPASVAGGIKTR